MAKNKLNSLFAELKSNTVEGVEVLKESQALELKGGGGCICKGAACYTFSNSVQIGHATKFLRTP